ncbi:MAG: ChbG/HpnK family deacetylase, partial [Alphaproteobacteria bacterium]|nr:ChbG/HpnK family deacetylase [Alphaproteobacteria bacterium]
MPKIIFNADDFGISHGVNKAIEKAHKEGVLNSTSIMITLKFVDEALEMLKSMPNLNVGLHANLTNEYAVLPFDEIPLLVDESGKFKHGFVDLAVLSLLHPQELKRQVKSEIRAQIDKALASGIQLSHLDSHRHVHMIPVIFKAFTELCEEYKIPRLRFINENPFRTIMSTKSYEWVCDGGLIKNLVLVSCALADKLVFGYKSDVYFYSIVNTCKISRDKVHNIKIPAKYKAVEIGIHPGLPDIDKAYLIHSVDSIKLAK